MKWHVIILVLGGMLWSLATCTNDPKQFLSIGWGGKNVMLAAVGAQKNVPHRNYTRIQVTVNVLMFDGIVIVLGLSKVEALHSMTLGISSERVEFFAAEQRSTFAEQVIITMFNWENGTKTGKLTCKWPGN